MKNNSALIVFVFTFLSLLITSDKVMAVCVGGGTCINYNWCQTTYPNSVFDEKDETTGEIKCKCKSGKYEWNEQHTACEIPQEEIVIGQPSFLIPPTVEDRCEDINRDFISLRPAKVRIGQSYNGYVKTRNRLGCGPGLPIPERQDDIACQRHYGLNSAWSGKSNSENGPICDCMDGYQFDDIQNTCIAKPITPEELPETSPTLTDDQICEEKYESAKSIVAPDGTRSCECRHGYIWNSDKTTCIYTSIASTAKPISRIENPVTSKSVTLASNPTVIVPVPTTSIITTSTVSEIITATPAISSTTQGELPPKVGFWARVWSWFRF